MNTVYFCAAVFMLHFVLKQVLARHDVVSCIFAAGSHLPLWMILVTVIFVIVRVAVFFVIPALLSWKLVNFVCMRAMTWRRV